MTARFHPGPHSFAQIWRHWACVNGPSAAQLARHSSAHVFSSMNLTDTVRAVVTVT